MPEPGWGDAAAGARQIRKERRQLIKSREEEIAAEKAATEAMEKELIEFLVSEIGFPRLAAVQVVDATTSVKADWAYCPDCRKKVKADFPNYKARLDAVKMIIEHKLGTPRQRQQVEIKVLQKPLHEMSMAEKQEYLHELQQHAG
jgi:hypothetical protein